MGALKIVYCGNFEPPFSTENDIRHALEALGHEVVPAQENRSRAREMLDLCASVGADLFLWTRTWGIRGGADWLLDELARRNVPTASWHLDLYRWLARAAGVAAGRDLFFRAKHVFTADGGSDDWFRACGVNHHWIRAGVSSRHVIAGGSARPGLACDVLFVGSGPEVYHREWPHRGELLAFLRSAYGDRFRKLGAPETDGVRGRDLADAMASAKVVVGDSLCPDFRHLRYWSDRVYETLGRGAFLLHPYVPGMEAEFLHRTHLVYWRFGDFDGLRREIDRYLEDEWSRRAVAESGFKRAAFDCTYERRAMEVLSILAVHEPALGEKLAA